MELPLYDIQAVRNHSIELEKAISDASLSGNYSQLADLNHNYRESQSIIASWDSLVDLLEKYSQAQGLLSDPDLGEIAAQEILQIEHAFEQQLSNFTSLTLPKLPHDANNAIFEIRAGTGGTEAALFGEEIHRMYLKYLSTEGYQIENLSTSYNEEGGIKEVIFQVNRPGAFGELRFEGGVHRVQRVPVTEAKGRIHTSAISVVVLPEIEVQEVDIKDQDIRVDVYRSSGPGGQSVNTTDSAVRITHIPTGIVVTCQDSKSQHRNKDKAMAVLASKLFLLEEEKELSQVNKLRSDAIQSGDRSAKIRTYNFPQGRITDHRVQITWFNLPEILEGNAGEMIKEVNSKLRQEMAQHA